MKLSGIDVRPSAPSRNLRHEAFVGELRRFSRSGIVRVAAHVSWTVWDKASPDPEPEDWYLCRAYVPHLAALGVAVCGDERDRREPTEPDIRALCREYLGVETPLTDQGFRAEELASLDAALAASPTFAVIPRAPDSLRAIHVLISMARDLRSQWDFRANTTAGLIRSWATAKNLETSQKGFLQRVCALWNVPLRDLLGCCYGLLAVGNMNPQSLGAFSLQDWNTGDVGKLGISADALRLVANRLARAPRDFHRWYRESVRVQPDPLRKYLPMPLVATPLIKLDRDLKRYPSATDAYVCPSPAHLVWYTQSIPVAAARSLAPTWKPEPRKDLMTEVGHAVSRYLGEMLRAICGDEAVVDLDTVFGDNAPTHADYAVIVGTKALIIESKTALGNAEGKSLVTPHDFVASWERIWSAYLQCARTPRAKEFKSDARLRKLTDFVYVVTFEEQMCPEVAALNGVAFAEGLFKAADFGRAEAITLQELEDALVLFGPDYLANAVEKKWAQARHAALLSAYLREQPRPPKPFAVRSYLRDHSRDLFGSDKVYEAILAHDAA